jgi:addiction module HigA family antidote
MIVSFADKRTAAIFAG